MKLLSLDVQNFRTMRKFHFRFPQEPGLYYITGENRDHPELDSNGVGKSSLWEAVNFALDGVTSDGLHGGDVVRDGEDVCGVELQTSKGTLRRVWTRGRKLQIFLDGKEVSQERLSQHFGGLSREQFLAAHCVPQTHTLFVDLKPAAQIALIQELLNMGRWVDYAENANARAKAIASDLDICTRKLERALGELDGLSESDALGVARQWERTHTEELEKLARNIAELEPEECTKKLEEQLQTCQSAITRTEFTMRQQRKKLEDAINEGAKLTSRKGVLSSEVARLEHRKEFFGDVGLCPTCDQAILPQHRTRCLEALTYALGQANAEQLEVQAKLNGVAQAKAEPQRLIGAAETRRRQLEAQRTDLQRAIDRKKFFNENRTVQLTRWEAALVKEKAAVNPWSKELERVQTRVWQIEEDLQVLRAECEALETRAFSLQLWGKGFKSIRSQLVSEALVQFELDIAAVLHDLGLHGWKVKPYIDPGVFETVRAASGFKFEVTEPNGIARPLEAYSGGELQRVRLAIQLGLASLIAIVNDNTWDFEVWDEPTTYLSEQGVQGLFRSLAERAQRLERPIWIIDHHQVHFAELTGVYRLVLEGSETQLEE